MRSIAPRTRECLCAIVASAGNHFQPIEGLKPLAATPTYAGHLLDRAYWRRQPPAMAVTLLLSNCSGLTD